MQAIKKGIEEEIIPTTTWEFMALSRDILGQPAMYRIYGIEHATLGRMCQNPEEKEDARRNPIDRMMLHFSRMVRAGEIEACRAQVAEFARIVGLELASPDASCRPEGKPLAEEIMDIHPAIVEHAQAMRRGDSVQAVEAWEREGIRQMRQATNTYREEKGAQ